MLDAATQAQLKSYLDRATQPIEIVASLDDSKASGELQSLLKDVAAASALIKLSESRDDNHRKPSFSINRPGENHGPRFAGLPMGHEFTSLILALLQIGGYPPKVEEDVLQQIRALDGDFEFEIYISLSCHTCPDVVQALNLMAVQNPRIKTTMIDGALFQGEIKGAWKKYGPKSTPVALNARRKKSTPKRRLTCSSSVVALPARQLPSMPLARAYAPASCLSILVARCWTPWGLKTTSPSAKQKGHSLQWHWKRTCVSTK